VFVSNLLRLRSSFLKCAWHSLSMDSHRTVESKREAMGDVKKPGIFRFFTLSQTELEILFCALGIYGCYLYYGILHEKLFKRSYSPDDQHWRYSLLLIAFQCFTNACVAAIVLLFQRARDGKNVYGFVPIWKYALMAVSYLLAMAFSFEALHHMTYPMQALGKSCKMIPVMLMGVLVRKRKYRWNDYLIVLMITTGVAIFSYRPQKADSSHQHTTPFGIALLFLSLFMDGLVGPYQEKIVAEHSPSTHQLMFHQNLWACLITFVIVAVKGELIEGIQFLIDHPTARTDVFLFALVSAFGQNFIFYTVRNVSALACTMITTTRKFFTILLSIIMYDHRILPQQWFAIILVFTGIILEHVFKSRAKRFTAQNKTD